MLKGTVTLVSARLATASAAKASMAGQYRLPDAQRRTDTLARTGLPPASLTASNVANRSADRGMRVHALWS